MRPISLLLVLTLIAGPGADLLAAQETAAPAQAGDQRPRVTPAAADVDALPFSLARIKRELAEAPPLVQDVLRLHYYIEVYGKRRELDILGDFDLVHGPVRYGAPTHREFLDLVTPQEFRAPPADLTVLTTAIIKWLTRDATERKK